MSAPATPPSLSPPGFRPHPRTPAGICRIQGPRKNTRPAEARTVWTGSGPINTQIFKGGDFTLLKCAWEIRMITFPAEKSLARQQAPFAPESERSIRHHLHSTRLVPNCIQISGSSMEPTLSQGWTVRIEKAGGIPTPGDIALLSISEGWLVHRVLGVFKNDHETLICHRGDGFGHFGICRAEAFHGRITAVIFPPDTRISAPDRMPQDVRRRYVRARTRCSLYFRLRRMTPDGMEMFPRRLREFLRHLILR